MLHQKLEEKKRSICFNISKFCTFKEYEVPNISHLKI